jgi:Sulfotransferase family
VALLLHIGLQKTASTWLQDKVFRSAAVGFATVGGEAVVKRHLIAPDDMEFDPAACRSAFLERIEAAGAERLVPVLSAERLSGDMLYGAYDSVRLADRLAQTFPGAKVLIVIREQRGMLYSTYQQYVKAGGQLGVGDYLRRASKSHPWPCDLRRYEYDRLVAYYQHLFGRDNVLTLPFELFRSEPAGFVRRIVAFAGVSPDPAAIEALKFAKVVNRSWPPAGIAVKRRLNWLVRERMNPWAPIDGRSVAGRRLTKAARTLGRNAPRRVASRIERDIRSTVASLVGDHYRESNARTSELIGLDLGSFGYDLAVPDAKSASAPTSPSVRTRS